MAQSNAEIIAAEPGVWTEIEGRLVPDYDSTLTPFAEGDVVTGKVVRVDKDEILVDIGYKSEGVIPISELSIRRNVDPDEEVALGDEVDALVMQKEDADGRLILSKKRARFEKAWRRIEEAAESGEPVEGQVIEVVKGGLILDLGVRGFLPASLVDIRRVQDLDEYLHKTLRCRVIELNRSRNNVVLSRRAVLEEERREVRQRILDTLDTGMVVEGVISNIVDFGAFVDLDGIDGLIHISELSWSHVNHPSEVLEIGQKVNVKVLDIDRDRQRISLGLKQTQADPWQQVLDAYQQGDVVHGKVTKVVTFGAFVEIVPGVEGLVHISELANHHVENPREVVSHNEDVLVKIIEIDADRRRLSLSLKRVTEEDEVRPRLILQGPAGAIASSVPSEADQHEEAAPLEAPPLDGEAEAAPELGLSEDVFGDTRASDTAEDELEPDAEAEAAQHEAETTPMLDLADELEAVGTTTAEPDAEEVEEAPLADADADEADDATATVVEGVAEASVEAPAEEEPVEAPAEEPIAAAVEEIEPEASEDEAVEEDVAAEVEEDVEAEVEAAVEEDLEAEAEEDLEARSRRISRPRPRTTTRRPRRTRPRPAPRLPTATRTTTRPDDGGRALRPPLVGLTGGIGSGKSAALAAFARQGCATLSSDAVVHELYRTAEVRDAVVARFGPGVLGVDGEVDRGRVGAAAFGDAAALGFLERLLHPLVDRELARWRASDAVAGAPLLVHEVPLLFEADLAGRYDAVVLVTAPDDVRRARVGARFDRRRAHQLPEEEKRLRAHITYDNVGTLAELEAWAGATVRRLTGAEA